ncbi:ketopantoate reductase family protein [Paenibacillaceae bacterium WGS1546]|uniref:ketopantoate reductase family protein n=1 Tax=Cohnella sp. WGS1546 TaxID=3366810 RepID=UPI00372D38F8
MNMPVAVLGGGALGLLLAGKLTASGSGCEVWTRTRAQADKVNAEGLTIEEAEGEARARIGICARPIDDVRDFAGGLVLLAVKQTALTDPFLLRLAEIVPAGGAIVPFQNGIGHLERLRDALPGRSVIAAVTTEGALRTGDNSVRHTGRGDVRLADDGIAAGNLLAAAERLLKTAGFSVFLSKHLEDEMLRKLLVNAVINPLTALLRIPNGELTGSPDRLTLMKALFRESYGILSERGLQEDEAACWNAVLNVCSATRSNRSSMLQDVLAGRRTEIDAINGAIARMAAGAGKPAPWNEAVTALVKALY